MVIDNHNDVVNITKCWSCKEEIREESLFCFQCGALQPLDTKDVSPFKLLALEEKYDLDENIIERNYFKFLSFVHPDRYVNKSDKEKDIAKNCSAFFNEAYETLKDPYLRTKALMRSKGHDWSYDEGSTFDHPDILDDIMTLKEKMFETSPENYGMLILEVKTLAGKAIKRISECFIEDHFDAIPLEALKLRYYQKTLDDIKSKFNQ